MSTVILEEAGPQPSGAPAQLTVRDDTGDQVTVDVNAEGAGYLVLADAIQSAWTVEVIGEPATLMHADHAFGAVYVPAGSSVVTFTFVGVGLRTGAVITALSIAVLVVVLALPSLIRRSRRRGTRASPEIASGLQ